jgi:asparagine synthase (glutamine-hydrolysing)
MPLGAIRALLRSPVSVADVVASHDFPNFYRWFVSCWALPPLIGLNPVEDAPDQILDSGIDANILGQRAWMMATDFRTYLHGDILVKVDRASMANSLEVRSPFLDPEVIDFAWSLQDELRIGSRSLKPALMDLARRLVPPQVVDRPKMGFGVPLARWLRGPLHDWMQDLLSYENMKRDGLLDPLPVTESMQALLAGDDAEQGRVWSAVTLCAWLRRLRAR